jgi:hypothetical protein
MYRSITTAARRGDPTRPTAVPPPSTSLSKPKPAEKPTPPGTDAVALAELRNAAFTYDLLRSRNDPAQFWEMLRLARSRRAFEADLSPTPQAEESLRQELEAIRRNHAAMVSNLRRYLKPISGLPEPAERLEMALAFLLASAREHQAVAKWLAEPGKHEAKAAEKLRSLATITDPYREALRPWTLSVSLPAQEEPPLAQAEFSAPEASPGLDPQLVDALRRALQCREIFSGLYLESELWETFFLALHEPDRTQASLDVLHRDAESELLEELQVDAEALFEKVTEMRSLFAGWVASVREAAAGTRPADAAAFDVALGLAMSEPSAQERVSSWLEDPARHGKEAAATLGPWWGRVDGYLKAASA